MQPLLEDRRVQAGGVGHAQAQDRQPSVGQRRVEAMVPGSTIIRKPHKVELLFPELTVTMALSLERAHASLNSLAGRLARSLMRYDRARRLSVRVSRSALVGSRDSPSAA